nr:hypothetical protein [uncultured Fluviicola sp.]
MKRIYFLLVILLFFSNDLFGQQDSLPVYEGSEQEHPNLPLDSIYFGKVEFPWGYPPPCIVPFKWDTVSFASLFYIPNTIFVLPYDAKSASKDIKSGKPLILFSAENGKVPQFDSKKDSEFQAKYQVKFISPSGFRIVGSDEEKAYNRVIFEYLDKKFGNAWRMELREDAIGFEVPKLVIPKLSSIAMQITNSANPLKQEYMNLDPETSIWWYVLPTSGFALLLALYFIKRKK